jgi:hypothetical protein
MKPTIEATDQLTEVDRIPVRIWKGLTEDGIPCLVMVHRLAVHDSQDSAQFEQELKEQLSPGRFVPLRNVL